MDKHIQTVNVITETPHEH